MRHARGPSKLDAHDDQDIAIELPFSEIGDQRGQRLVHLRQPFALGEVQMEGAGVVIPTEVLRRIVGSGRVDVDDRFTCFVETPGQVATRSPAMAGGALA